MIKKIICLLWGHQTVVKAYTGETMTATSFAGHEIQVSMYSLKRLKFCKRCGSDCYETEIETK